MAPAARAAALAVRAADSGGRGGPAAVAVPGGGPRGGGPRRGAGFGGGAPGPGPGRTGPPGGDARFGDGPPRFGDRPPRFGEGPPRYGDRPPRFGNRPDRFGDRPAPQGDRPPFGDRRPGQGGGQPFGRGRPTGGRPRPGTDRPRFDDRRPPAPFEGGARDFGDPPGSHDNDAGPDIDAGEAPGRQNRPWVDRGPRPGGPRRPGQWERPGGPGRFVRPGAPAPPLEEGEELVAGRRPVEEAFAAGRPARRLLVTPQRRQALERIVLHATTLRIPIVEVEGGSLTSLAGFDGHQGVAVVVEARRFASVDDILARSIEHGEPAFVLVLDSLEDPQNVGTLLRSAEAAGVHGVIFPTERQAPLSPAAIKASAGATEHLLLAPVDDLAGTLTDLHLRGLRIVGSDAEASLSAREADLRGPIAIVIGSEGHGVAPAIRRRSDMFVRIPMRGAIGSLNAAVAGSVLLFEALGQRDPGARPSPPATPPRPVAPVLREDSAAAADAAAPDVQADVQAPADLPVTAERPAPKRTRTRLTAEDLDTAAPTADEDAAVGSQAAEPEPDVAPPPQGGPSSQDIDGRARARGCRRPQDQSLAQGLDHKAGARGGGCAKGEPRPQVHNRGGHDGAARLGSGGRCAAPGRPAEARWNEGTLPARLTGSPEPTYHLPALRSGQLWFALRADVAQLVEQRFCKPPVPGSSPVVGSIFAKPSGPHSSAGRALPW